MATSSVAGGWGDKPKTEKCRKAQHEACNWKPCTCDCHAWRTGFCENRPARAKSHSHCPRFVNRFMPEFNANHEMKECMCECHTGERQATAFAAREGDPAT